MQLPTWGKCVCLYTWTCTQTYTHFAAVVSFQAWRLIRKWRSHSSDIWRTCKIAANIYLPGYWRKCGGGGGEYHGNQHLYPLLATWLLNWANLFLNCQPIKTVFWMPNDQTLGCRTTRCYPSVSFTPTPLFWRQLFSYWRTRQEDIPLMLKWKSFSINGILLFGNILTNKKSLTSWVTPCVFSKVTTPIHKVKQGFVQPIVRNAFHTRPFT